MLVSRRVKFRNSILRDFFINGPPRRQERQENVKTEMGNFIIGGELLKNCSWDGGKRDVRVAITTRYG